MKAKLVFLLFCVLPVFPIAAQFVWSNPQPAGFSNNKIAFINDSTGYIMNENGDLIKTTNAGSTWSIQQNLPKGKTMDILDSLFIVGGWDSVIYVSTDRAQTWTKRILPRWASINKIQIVNRDTIFAVSKDLNLSNTVLYQSVNRGKTWQLINSNYIIKSIDFINSTLGYASSYDGVSKTMDGGKTWQLIYNMPGYPIKTIEFLNDHLGFAYQDMGAVYKTTNGGTTWTACLDPNNQIDAISFLNADTVFVAGDNGVIYRSTDQGINWQYAPAATGDRYNIYSISFPQAGLGFFVGLRGRILKTTDLGTTYQDYAPAYNNISPFQFPSPSVGYASSWDVFLKTTDGGKSWVNTPIMLSGSSAPLSIRLRQLHFFSKDTGLAFTEMPVQLFKTYNGGQNWKEIPLPLSNTQYLNGLFFLKNTGYINIDGAYGHTVLQTKDGGETWQTQSITTQNGFQHMFFTDEKTGYRSIGATLYKTYDSAKTWQAIMNNTNIITDIWFTDAATGYVVSDHDYNQITVDSGKTWTRFAIWPDNYNFNDVYAIKFFNKKVGYLAGKDGIYKTSDGGKRWKPEKSSTWSCKIIEMTADTAVFVAGEYGTIMRKDMREYSIDSFNVFLQSSCTARLSAWVTATLSSVDSVWLEYGTTGFTKTLVSNPGSVTDSSVKIDIALQDLSGDSSYKARVKVRYRGNFFYSDSLTFKPTIGLPKPTITYNGTLLLSSASAGNQWYLNNMPIIGATGVSYQPLVAGSYSVQQKLNGCTSALSSGFVYIVTAIPNALPAGSVRVYPNPVSAMLLIDNPQQKKLHITLMDEWGRELIIRQLVRTQNAIDVGHLCSGVYWVLIEDVSTHKQAIEKVVKL